MADSSLLIVTCVHGTWARGSRWPDLETALADALPHFAGRIDFRYFEWSGRNSLAHRARAAAELRHFLLQQTAGSPDARHILLAHSHGANVLLHALRHVGARDETCNDDPLPRLAGIVLLSPPILNCKLVDNPAGAATRLLLGAVAAIPVVLLAFLSVASAFDIGRTARLAGSLAGAALWLALFVPARVRRRAQRLAQQLALPRIDFPGLVVQVPGDEATAALTSIAAFDRLARYVRSRIFHVRPFARRQEDRVRRARTTRDMMIALAQALTLVPAGAFWAWLLYRGVQSSQWLLFGVALPIAIIVLTGALATVGGSVLLLLLLPSCSFLLWPFGIFPTAAAALLSVSVETTPTDRWDVVRVPDSVGSGRGWKHSTYANQEALAGVADYVRALVGLVRS